MPIVNLLAVLSGRLLRRVAWAVPTESENDWLVNKVVKRQQRRPPIPPSGQTQHNLRWLRLCASDAVGPHLGTTIDILCNKTDQSTAMPDRMGLWLLQVMVASPRGAQPKVWRNGCQ